MTKRKNPPASFSLSLFSNSLSLYRERVRVRDICAAQLSEAPHILAARESGRVPHPTLEDERRPLPTQGEAIRGEAISSDFLFLSAIAGAP